MKDYNSIIQSIKKDFFSFRNGIVADSLRKLYTSSKMIFGLTVPQFLEMSKKYPKDTSLGLALWDDNSSREGRLFALYLINPSEIDLESAKKMVQEVESNEEAEFLSFKVLGRMPESKQLYREMSKEELKKPFTLHCINMLKKNLERSQY